MEGGKKKMEMREWREKNRERKYHERRELNLMVGDGVGRRGEG